MASVVATITGALAKVLLMRGVTTTASDGTVTMGLIPSEVAAQVPQAVLTLPAGVTTSQTTASTATVQMVDNNALSAQLIEAIKELNTNVTNSNSSVVTVATLPAASASKGRRMFVTDANLGLLSLGGLFGSTVAAGGSVTVPVWCDGTNWRIG